MRLPFHAMTEPRAQRARMSKQRPFPLLTAALLLAVLCAACKQERAQEGCTDPLGCVELKAGEPLTIGVIQSLSGKVAPLGQEQLRGLELSLARRGGKVLGHEVRQIVEDSGCQPEGGANAALRIVADPKVAAIFGTTCSGDAATAAEVMSRAGLTMISGNNSAPFLTSIGGKRAPSWQPGYFRTAPNEETSGPAAAEFAFKRLGIRTAVVINDGDIYTSGLTEGFSKRFRELGGEVSLTATVNKNDTNMRPVLEAVAATKAGLLFFPLFQPEGNHVLRQARKMPEMQGVVLMSDGSLIEQSFIDDVKSAAVGMYFVGPTPPKRSTALDKLEGEYRERFKSAPSTFYYLSAYEAAELLFEAMERAAVQAPDGSLRIGREALRTAMLATKDRKSVSGTFSCNEFGDCAKPSFNILRLSDPAKGVEGLKANVLFTYTPEP